MFTVQQENATKFGIKNEILHTFYIIKLWLHNSRFTQNLIWFDLHHAVEAIL